MMRFRDISINKKLFYIMAIMAVLITTELVVLTYTIKILSSVRSYVGGEGLWSKAQKNAAYYLIKYAYTHNEKDYEYYKDFLQVPLSDHQARIALGTQPQDYEKARQGFLGGRIHKDDIDGIIWLFTNFHRVHYINKAIQKWTEADNLMEEFVKVGDELHKLISSKQASESEIALKVARVDQLNDQLTVVEDEFSYTLGEASRWLENLILKLIIVTAITVEFTGIFLTILTGLEISRSINSMNRVTKKITAGDFSEHVAVLSKDEIGQLATSLNTMIDELEKNINQRQRVENILIDKNIALTNSDLAKDQFMSHISHELRTPLNGIITMTQLLLTSNLTNAQRDQLDIINELNEQLLSVVNQVLDFSKVESGNVSVEHIKFNLKDTLSRLIAGYKVIASKSGILLDYDIDMNVPAEITGDMVKIRQILVNLLDNAVKFTNQGTIHLNVSAIPFDKSTLNIVFEVSDTGIGITPEALNKIFKPFSQGDSSMTRKYGGTGLGLAISKKLAELMNGSISVESSEKGSTFKFIVPSTYPENYKMDFTSLGKQNDSPLASHVISGHILLVEDNPLNQRTLTILLNKLGYTSELAEDGVEALKVLARSKFDVIIMDCQMPNMNGVQTTIEYRKREIETGEYTPIIGLTARAMENDKKRCMECGMDGYMSKPFNIKDLNELITWLIEKKRARSS